MKTLKNLLLLLFVVFNQFLFAQTKKDSLIVKTTFTNIEQV
jgi:hypothetical protein